MVSVKINLKSQQILSVTDHGPRPGDDAYIPIMAGLIAKEIVRKEQEQ